MSLVLSNCFPSLFFVSPLFSRLSLQLFFLLGYVITAIFYSAHSEGYIGDLLYFTFIFLPYTHRLLHLYLFLLFGFIFYLRLCFSVY